MKEGACRKPPEEELAFPGLHHKVLELVEALPRGIVFDGAAGNGDLSRKLEERGFRVLSTDLLKRKNLQGGLRFFLSDLNRDLALKSETVDLCISLETIEHLENPWHFVRELSRVLKPGGRLVLSTPNIEYLTCKVFFFLRGSFYPFFGEWQYRVIGHITPLSKYYLRRILSASGFRVERAAYNRYRLPRLRLPSPFRLPIFGECLILQAVKREEGRG